MIYCPRVKSKFEQYKKRCRKKKAFIIHKEKKRLPWKIKKKKRKTQKQGRKRKE